jgi:asparagine synthase (glutamine-hydrolysing)
MHVLVAAAGAAVSRFDDLVLAAACGTSCTELTVAGGPVRLGVAGGGAITAGASRDGRAAAVVGSAVLDAGPTIADDVLDAYERAPLGILDDRPDDLVALVADAEAKTLTMAAGAGNHRLFVADLDGGCLVATQLAPLTRALGPDLAVDRSYEDFFLGFGFLPDGRTVYAGVRALGAGEVRVFPSGAPGRVRPRVAAGADIDVNDAPAIGRALHDAFFAALEEQAGPRRRHAVLLGGFDSALVAAGLRRLGHDVDCYTFGFGDPAYEQRNVDVVASAIGAEHRWVRFTPELIGALLEQFDRMINQPGPQPHYQLHTVHASRVIAADGHTHVFTGDGCDAAFLGYPMVNQRARTVARLVSVPAPVLRTAARVLGRRGVERRLGHVARMGRSLVDNLTAAPAARGHLPTRYLDDVAVARVRADSPPQQESVDTIRDRLAAAVAGLDPTRKAFHGNALTGQSKAKVEGSVATSGVAQFSPFLHPAVKTLASRLPVEALRPSGSRAGAAGKAVLVAMARQYDLLPEAVIAMPKQSPVDSPIDRWYAGPLRPLVMELLSSLPFEYDRAYVDELLAPKWAEEVFRRKVSLGHHAFQAIGLLCSYATFTRHVTRR